MAKAKSTGLTLDSMTILGKKLGDCTKADLLELAAAHQKLAGAIEGAIAALPNQKEAAAKINDLREATKDDLLLASVAARSLCD